MICRVCHSDVEKYRVGKWCNSCINISNMKMDRSTIARASQMVNHNRSVFFVHDLDFDEMSERFQIPYGRKEFFEVHPDGKIEIEVESWTGDVLLQGVYVG
jgi:hypothetical protein